MLVKDHQFPKYWQKKPEYPGKKIDTHCVGKFSHILGRLLYRLKLYTVLHTVRTCKDNVQYIVLYMCSYVHTRTWYKELNNYDIISLD